jgi:RimJ/RimL family protein N-acetyltransferase
MRLKPRCADEWLAANHRAAATVCIINPGNRASLRAAAKLGCMPYGEAVYRQGNVTSFRRVPG